jgi:lantibiotic modifying enzyme
MAETGVVDAGLCHGASGLALTFARLFRATGEERLRDAAVRWFERTLALRRPGNGIAGFRSWVPEEDGAEGWAWSDDASFLSGASGIGLALLAAATCVEPAWDSVLLLRPPPAGGEA